jgi:SAM-dependent methyltransferase
MHSTKEFWETRWLKNPSQRYPSLNPTNDLPWEIHTHDPYLPLIIKQLKNKTGKVIDVGCGSGYDSNFFHEQGYDVTGIDISETAIKIAKRKFSNITFDCKDVLQEQFDSDFNLVYDKGCIHNFHREETKIRLMFLQFYKMLKVGGEVIIIAGNRNELGDEKTTQAPKMKIADIENNAFPMFNIKLAQEITFVQNKNYGNSLGWLFFLEKV